MRGAPGMVKPSSFGFFDVSTGVVAAGRSAMAVAALMECVDMQTVLCAPAGRAILAIRLRSIPLASSRMRIKVEDAHH